LAEESTIAIRLGAVFTVFLVGAIAGVLVSQWVGSTETKELGAEIVECGTHLAETRSRADRAEAQVEVYETWLDKARLLRPDAVGPKTPVGGQ
jgi:hypothetical protein